MRQRVVMVLLGLGFLNHKTPSNAYEPFTRESMRVWMYNRVVGRDEAAEDAAGFAFITHGGQQQGFIIVTEIWTSNSLQTDHISTTSIQYV
jgi:hypothetical protein